MSNQKYYTLRQVSEITGVKMRTLRSWLACGKLNAIKYPNQRRWFVSADELKRLTTGTEA